LFVSTNFWQSKQDDSEGGSVTIEKDANANISIAMHGLRKNVAFLPALQTTNYVLINSFCSQQKKYGFSVSVDYLLFNMRD